MAISTTNQSDMELGIAMQLSQKHPRVMTTPRRSCDMAWITPKALYLLCTLLIFLYCAVCISFSIFRWDLNTGPSGEGFVNYAGIISLLLVFTLGGSIIEVYFRAFDLGWVYLVPSWGRLLIIASIHIGLSFSKPRETRS